MKPLVIANWKLNPDTPKQAIALFTKTYTAVRAVKNATVVVCPPPLLLGEVARARGAKKAVALGAQDCFSAVRGAHTGESSCATLTTYGASFVIIGHSERRAQGETDARVAEKVATALASGLTAVVCIGETERTEEGDYYHTLRTQLLSALSGIKRAQLHRIVVAYEPVWAIGKKAEDALSPQALQETVLFLKKILIETYGRASASSVRVLYGGSVKPENAEEFVSIGGADGLLVGSASLDAEIFASVIIRVAGCTAT